MNINLKLETGQYCYVYSQYKIEKINDRKYIIPEIGATKKGVSVTEHIERQLIDLLNIGKKAYFYEDNIEADILNYVQNYGLLGLMADFPINKYYILDDDVIFRDYNYNISMSAISVAKLEEYIRLFMPKLNKEEIMKKINIAKEEIQAYKGDMERFITGNINEKLIYSTDYAELIDPVIYYARDLYKALYELTDNSKTYVDFPVIANTNNLATNAKSLSSGELELQFCYLKQTIDFAFALQLAQNVRLLKICNFCKKAFILSSVYYGHFFFEGMTICTFPVDFF